MPRGLKDRSIGTCLGGKQFIQSSTSIDKVHERLLRRDSSRMQMERLITSQQILIYYSIQVFLGLTKQQILRSHMYRSVGFDDKDVRLFVL